MRNASLKTFFVCILLGPLVGGMCFGSIIIKHGCCQHFGILYYLKQAFPFLLFGYIFGILQAATAGLIFIVSGKCFGKLAIWIPLTSALVTSLISWSFADFFDSNETYNPRLISTILIVNIAATIACWAVVRRYWKTEVE